MSNDESSRHPAFPVGGGRLAAPARPIASAVCPFTTHPRAVNMSLLLELERDKTARRAKGVKEKREDGRGHLDHATSVAETAYLHTAHCASQFSPLGCRALTLPMAGSKGCMFTGK